MIDIDGDWRDERDDYVLGWLLHEQDRLDYERQRDDDLGLVDDDDRPGDWHERWVRDKREVEDRCELERIAEHAVIAQWWRDLYEREHERDN